MLLGLLYEKAFRRLADAFQGYDLSISGKMIFPKPDTKEENIDDPIDKEAQ